MRSPGRFLITACGALVLLALAGIRVTARPPQAASASGAAAEPRLPIDDEAREAALALYETRCTRCHGPDGRGDGPESLPPAAPARDFTAADWQGGVDDAFIDRIIVEGGEAVGCSPRMPSNPDLAARPELVTALRDRLRELGRPGRG
jgi:mono/diheme cytochrome c family protein